MADELHHFNAAIRMHESIKRATVEVLDQNLPKRFIGWVIDHRFDSDPNYGPLDIDQIGAAGSLVKVATVSQVVYDADGNPLTDNAGRTTQFPDRSQGVIRAFLPGTWAPVIDGTAVWVEGRADSQYYITQVLPTPYINYFQDTIYQNIIKTTDLLLSGRRTGFVHTYDEFDYPLGNSPFIDQPSRTLVNLCTTPGFENGIGVWNKTTGTTIAASTAQFHKGTHSGAITWSTTDANARAWIPFATEPGKVYTVAFWQKTPAAAGSFVYMGAGDGDGTTFNVLDNIWNVGDPLNTWRFYYFQFTAVSTQSHFFVKVVNQDTTGVPAVWLDELLFVEGAQLYTPFDGSDANCSWTGAADQSISVKVIPATEKLLPGTTATKYGLPIYVPFYSDTIVPPGSYYLGTWSNEGWDTATVLGSGVEQPPGMVELNVKLWAGNDTTVGGGTITDPDFAQNVTGQFVMKRYRFHAQSPDPNGFSLRYKLFPYYQTGPTNGVDFELDWMPIASNQFSLWIRFTRDDYASAPRRPTFIGAIDGWTDIENLADITELSPNAIDDHGHRGAIDYSGDPGPYVADGTNYDNGPSRATVERAKGPFLSPAYAWPRHAQVSLVGGGEITYKAGKLKWTDWFRMRTGGYSNYDLGGSVLVDYMTPANNGELIPVFGNSGVTTVAVDGTLGIPLAADQALYYELPLGDDNANNTSFGLFRIVDSGDDQAPFEIPWHWIFIASVDSLNDFCVKLGTGQIIRLPAVGPNGWTDWTLLTLVGTPSPASGVGYSDTAEYKPAYRYSMEQRKVEFRGLARPLATLSTNQTIVTGLPVAIQPAKICILNHNSGQASFGRLDIRTDGTIAERANPGLTTSNYISFDGLFYCFGSEL